jgi:hypothetical protein
MIKKAMIKERIGAKHRLCGLTLDNGRLESNPDDWGLSQGHSTELSSEGHIDPANEGHQ